jgi:hypothetical protein
MAAKSSPARQQKHLAVLIDADNASAAIVEGLFEKITKYGVPVLNASSANSKHTAQMLDEKPVIHPTR